MSGERRPIEPSEIRKGDLIRAEFGDRDAREYVASHYRHRLGARGVRHYLLDRVDPAWQGVRHGWLDGRFVTATHVLSLGWWRVDGVNTQGQPTRSELHDIDRLIPATPVPTVALDRFMRVRNTPGATLGDIYEASRNFLAAVDKAGEQS